MTKLKNIILAAMTAFPLIGCDSPRAIESGEPHEMTYQVRINEQVSALVVESASDDRDSGEIILSARLGEREFEVLLGADESTVAEAGQVLIRLERTDSGLLATNERGEFVLLADEWEFADHIQMFDAEAAVLLDASVMNEVMPRPEVAKRWIVVAILIARCIKGHVGSDGWSIGWDCP